MIRNLLATTALATLDRHGCLRATGPGGAGNSARRDPQPAATTDQAPQPVVKADGHLATNMIGESVYNGDGDNAENIGDVNDIVVAKDGKVEAVVVGVGGFLGIGEHNVAVEFHQAELG